ncbi:glycoside hydrolase family 5 protein [Paraglaciecola aquimarina]|uniref:Glycoside hydrolase family 5 protein n=1 Tax=Paraglaciecola algarum TaxID=3050085 RepID=A0ABS9D279_9ALTE|nr:glycoside hydrolase family 5 protein [Paraglaciecola sp. G1-23]MCF2946729.1 glycoside hydrolase family 5 protein [Paraglaciecola sp. G1-23]
MNFKSIAIALFTLLVSANIFAADKKTEPEGWWGQPYPSQFDTSQLTKQLDFISVQGNQLVDGSGQQVIFKGMNIADPDKLLREGQWSEKLFKEVKAWGANIVRLPIHPISWQGHGKEAYFKLIDQAIIWANAQEMYIIIDWHSIGYLPSELFQHPMYDTTMKETRTFWKDIAFRYSGVSTVAVYELFNEPTDQGGRAGKANWLEWKAFNEELIDIIYAHDKKVVPLVAGFNWAYDLRPIQQNPVDRKGIAYAAHPYPQKAKPTVKSKENFFKLWEEVWGFAAKDYPVIATELGWVKADGKGAHIPVINDGSYGPQIIEFMQQRGISWVAWVFDPDWSPTMISDWNFTPTQQGAFFKKEMLKHE